MAHTTPADRQALAERVARADTNVASVAVSTRDPDAPQLLGSGAEARVGPAELEHRPDPTAPWHYAAHGAFSQAHAGQLAKLHAALEAELAAGRASGVRGARVLELYAGSGLLSLRLAAHGAAPTAVESFVPAARMAERAAAAQGLVLRVLADDAGRALADLARAKERFDAVLVNPPRRGLAREVRRVTAALHPARLLYVSCEPDTLARDAAHLALLGFRLERATPFDMIPLSDAVETLACFVPAPPPAPRVLFENDEVIAVEQAALELLVPTPNEPASLLGRVRELPGARSATSPRNTSQRTSGVAVLARRAEGLGALERGFESATSEWELLVRGVMRAQGNLKTKSGVARYERVEVTAGHSLLRVRASGVAPSDVCRTLARLRHPVLGDEQHGDRRANVHFSHRHQLERIFWHRTALELALPGVPPRIECALSPDLALTLGSLRDRDVRD
jgi:23S rRNA (uracil1939-C5)-methyltransferase